MLVRLLHIGDIVGKPGRTIVRNVLAALRKERSIDFVVANAENAAGGSGLTPQNYRELTEAGVDCITLGDHIYRRNEIVAVLEKQPNIVKPANYPKAAPGKSCALLEVASHRVAVISLIGRVFMKPVDCPFEAVDRELRKLPSDVRTIVVDYHAEATSDMQLMGRYLDGRVSSVLGTHTHVTTADECIFPGGTAFQCDIGMTGPHHSILGREIARVLETTRTFRPTRFDVATDDVRLVATQVDVDPVTGKAVGIERVCVRSDGRE